MHKFNHVHILVFAALALLLQSCSDNKESKPALAEATSSSTVLLPKAAAENYWYQGKAELAAYDVQQERYGEMRKAEEVLIFVTEDFSKSKQVKLDDAAAAGANRVPIIKTNVVRKFKTGIYDYSLMQSIFTPMDGSPTIKSTVSVQDWCGHVFGQLNRTADGWSSKHFSYFESEGDKEQTISADYLEDEILNRLRLGPDKIKTGAVKLVPAEFYLRMRHKPFQAEDAMLTINASGDQLVTEVKYNSIARTLSITSENQAPWRILGWEETADGKLMSKGTLKAIRMEPYWQQHDNDDLGMRDSLKLN